MPPKRYKQKSFTLPEPSKASLDACRASPNCSVYSRIIPKPIKKKKSAPKPKQIKKATPKPVARSYSGLHPDYPYRDGTSTFGGTSMSHSFSAPKSAAKRKIQTKKAIRKGKRGAKK
jgi:hypothetical protein